MSLPMKEYVIGGEVFEVVDQAARNDIDVLKTDVDIAEDNIKNLQNISQTYEEDIQKLKLASIEPDTTLGIEGACADSKAVGNAFDAVNIEIDKLDKRIDGLTPEDVGAVSIDNVVNNINTVESGYVLDARQGYELKTLINQRATTATYTACFKASDWTIGDPHMQTVPVMGILKTDNPFVDIDMSFVVTGEDGIELTEQWNFIGRISTNNDSVTAYCYLDVPSVDINIILKVVR